LKPNEYISHLFTWELNSAKFSERNRKPLRLGIYCASLKYVKQCFVYFLQDFGLMASDLSLLHRLWDHCSLHDASEHEFKFNAWELITYNLGRLGRLSQAVSHESEDAYDQFDKGDFMRISGDLPFCQQRYGEAEEAFRESYRIRAGLEGIHRERTFFSFCRAAEAVVKQNRFQDAEEMWLEGLELIATGERERSGM
jgi:hypothetical protein